MTIYLTIGIIFLIVYLITIIVLYRKRLNKDKRNRDMCSTECENEYPCDVQSCSFFTPSWESEELEPKDK